MGCTLRKQDFHEIEPVSLGFRVWRGQPSPMKRPHQHTDIEFNFCIHGFMRYFLAGRFVTIPRQRLGGLWAGMPHRLMEIEPGTECIWITMPLAWVLSWKLPEVFTRRLLSGELALEPDPVRANEDLALQERWVAELKTNDAELRQIALLEVEARIRRLARSLTALGKGPRTRAGSAEAGPAEKLAAYIGLHYRENLSVEDIATAAGLHPNYAMTLFKRSCGMSIWEYLTRMRVSHAQRVLLTSDSKVLDVALDAGFGSASRFYDTFTKVVGCTPKEYRSAMRET